jgi:hypothetical protein
VPTTTGSDSGGSPEERLKEEDRRLNGYNGLMRSKITLLLLAAVALLPTMASTTTPS